MIVANLVEGQKIKHVKSFGIYTFVGETKAKIDGCWVIMFSYANDAGLIFSRFEHDFDGFELAE